MLVFNVTGSEGHNVTEEFLNVKKGVRYSSFSEKDCKKDFNSLYWL